MRSQQLVLAGDVGGTKTNLGLFAHSGKKPALIALESYSSRDAANLTELITRFVDKHPARVTSACFGIAGPVHEGVCKTTNLPWVVSENDIKSAFQWEKVTLINDLVAGAYAVPVLEECDTYCLNHGQVDPRGTIGLVAPGTGLGVALIAVVDGKLRPLASEGGHVDFSPRNDKEIRLLQHLLARLPDHVSVERLASGPGLVTIFQWLKEYRKREQPSRWTERMNNAPPDRLPMMISEAALLDKEPLCTETLDLFVSILGGICGNLALTGMTTGGLFLGGGVSPKILPKLQEPIFIEAFTAKGRFRDLLANMPVKVILNDKAALMGGHAAP